MIKNTAIPNEDTELRDLIAITEQLNKRIKQAYLKRIVAESEGVFNCSQRVSKLCLAKQCVEELIEELREAAKAPCTQESYWATEV